MVTIKDIAKKANVSTATVSYVLNETGNISEETRKRVLKVIEELNYRPNQIAKSLKMQKTKSIGVVVEDITVFNSPEIIDGINEYAEKMGFTIILTNMRLHKRIGHNFSNVEQCKEIASKLVDELLSKKVDGIIYIGMHTRDVTEVIKKINKPIVFTYCYTTSDDQYSINYDDEQAAYDATNYLIQKGHRKIALISGLIDSIPAHSRYTGYYEALKKHQLMFNPAYIKTGDWEYESGYKMTKELLELKDRPTAILAMNDLMAGGAIEACKDLGLDVPKDISIIGFDNRECSQYYFPKLSTMSLPLRKMGQLSTEVIVDLINNKSPDLDKLKKLRCELIERDSVASIQTTESKK